MKLGHSAPAGSMGHPTVTWTPGQSETSLNLAQRHHGLSATMLMAEIQALPNTWTLNTAVGNLPPS